MEHRLAWQYTCRRFLRDGELSLGFSDVLLGEFFLEQPLEDVSYFLEPYQRGQRAMMVEWVLGRYSTT